MAAEAALSQDHPLANKQVLGLGRHLRQAVLGDQDGHPCLQEVEGEIITHFGVDRCRTTVLEVLVSQPHQIRRDVRGFLVRQAQVGHQRLGVVGRRILDPLVEPPGRHLAADIVQVGPKVAQIVLLAVVVAIAHHVAGLTPRLLHEALSPSSVAGRRVRVGDGFGMVEQILRNPVDGHRADGAALGRVHVLEVEDLGHLRRRAEATRIPDPLLHPRTVQLCTHPAEVGTDLTQIQVSLDLVAPSAPERLDQMDTTVEIVRFGHIDDTLVTGRAGLLDIPGRIHRVIPVMHLVVVVEPFPPRLLFLIARCVGGIVERHTAVAPDVATGATCHVDRVGRSARHEQIQIRMRSEYLRHPDPLVLLIGVSHIAGERLVLERRGFPVDLISLAVDVHVARVTPVDLGDGDEVDVVLEVAEDDLPDLDRWGDEVQHRHVPELVLEDRQQSLEPALQQGRLFQQNSLLTLEFRPAALDLLKLRVRRGLPLLDLLLN